MDHRVYIVGLFLRAHLAVEWQYGVACLAGNSSSPQDSPPWRWVQERWGGSPRWRRLPRAPRKQPGRRETGRLVNPHDIMFYNTDALGQNVQDVPKPLLGIAREPDDGRFLPGEKANWAASTFDP